MIRVCFAAPLARPILEPGFQCDFGGAEVRAVNFATGLAREEEFDVSVVLRAYRRELPRRLGQLTGYFERTDPPIPRTRDLTRGPLFPWRLACAKLQKLQRSLRKRRQDSSPVQPSVLPLYRDLPVDVLCVFGVHHYAAHVIRSGQDSNKRTVLFLASETDLDERYLRESTNAYRQQSHMCRYVLEQADWIVAQTQWQQRLLRDRFNRASHLIRNPIDVRVGERKRPPVDGDYLLWIGRADTFSKRADKFFQLAATCPDVSFLGIVNKRDERTFAELMSQVPNNVRVLEHVPFSQIDCYVAHASALVNTSDAEGFPNAFLQAGKYGVPVLSLTVDPEEMFSVRGCGLVADGNLEKMTRTVQRFWSHRASGLGDKLSGNISRYVREHHAIEDRSFELKSLLSNALERKAA